MCRSTYNKRMLRSRNSGLPVYYQLLSGRWASARRKSASRYAVLGLMRTSQIEFKVAQLLEIVDRGGSIEDNLVELKSELSSNHHKVARQIAAHANAARGEDILWVVGVDEKRVVVGIKEFELADWWPRTERCFDDGVTPTLFSLVVKVDESHSVLALVFNTRRAPFVVKTENAVGPNTEVPWREGNSTRSAKRTDLLKILVPAQRIPRIDVLGGKARLYWSRESDSPRLSCAIEVECYVSTSSADVVVFPFHMIEASYTCDMALPDPRIFETQLGPPIRVQGDQVMGQVFNKTRIIDSHTILGTSGELIVQGPGLVELRAHIEWDGIRLPDPAPGSFDFSFVLKSHDDSGSVNVSAQMKWDSESTSDSRRHFKTA